jgi:predicted ATP-grasp superfamily ATP-dependent carboligase
MEACALVLGNYVNAYSTVQSLHESGVRDIVVLSDHHGIAGRSNKIVTSIEIEQTDEAMLDALTDLHRRYAFIVPFPSSDSDVEALARLASRITSYCFLPFAQSTVLQVMDKLRQYSACDRLGVPYPVTIELSLTGGGSELADIELPVIIKPTRRFDVTGQVFRNLKLTTQEELEGAMPDIQRALANGYALMASEFIPATRKGAIVAYTAYRSHKGEILNEWIGNKLSQYPNDHGVFAAASNQCDPIILDYGRTLMRGLDLVGINEAEFKLDARVGQYKLIEINLRSMMWHRIGALSGVNLPHTQWCDALGLPVPRYEQDRSTVVHYSYLKHVLLNWVSGASNFHECRFDMKGGDKNYRAVHDPSDPVPYLIDTLKTMRGLAATLRRRILL